VVEGFIGQGFAEELTLALERRFLQSGTPRGLTIVFTAAQGDGTGRGLDTLCHEGLLCRALGGHYALSKKLQKLAVDGSIEAYNLPQGVLAQLFRDTAGARPGLLTRVGLGTFVNPRNGGGKVNDKTTEDRVSLMAIDGAEYLF
jgi:propionate CoA-transferase